jgi:hypothetical protein
MYAAEEVVRLRGSVHMSTRLPAARRKALELVQRRAVRERSAR